jgi:Ca-activated chloride channel family protein
MSFGNPWLLLCLIVVPLAIGGYLLLERRRAKRAANWSSPALLSNMVPRRPGFRRYIPLTLFLLALILLLAGFARPQATINVPREGAMVVLALDISGSMETKDVIRPGGTGYTTRMIAAHDAAAEFLEELPDKYRVSLVTFGSRGTVKVPPTPEQDRVAAALPRKAGTVGTAMAGGIDSAVKVAKTPTGEEKPGQPPPPAAVLLISDGSNNAQAQPHEAAVKALKAKVKIWTVLLGTDGPLAKVEQRIVGGPPGSTEVYLTPVEPAVLQDVARTTGGEFFKAHTAKQLKAVYEDLHSQLVKDKKKREISVAFAGGAVVLLIAGALLSGFWFRRLV